MTVKITYIANFFYPGTLFPEETTREIHGYVGPVPTLKDVIAAQPTETEGTYFVKDGWYAVSLRKKVEELFQSTESTVTKFIQTENVVLEKWIVGEKIHVDDIGDQERGGRNSVLASNIRGNTKDGYGVLTRAGNWQLAQDWDHVISASEARNG